MGFEERVRERSTWIKHALADRYDPKLAKELHDLERALQWCRCAGIQAHGGLNLPEEDIVCRHCVYAREGGNFYLCYCPDRPFLDAPYILYPGEICRFYRARENIGA